MAKASLLLVAVLEPVVLVASSAKHGRRGSFLDTAFDRNYPIHGEKIKTAGKERLVSRRQSAGMTPASAIA